MKGKGFTDEQIRERYTDVCRQIGVSEASFFCGRRKSTPSSGLQRSASSGSSVITFSRDRRPHHAIRAFLAEAESTAGHLVL